VGFVKKSETGRTGAAGYADQTALALPPSFPSKGLESPWTR